MNDKKKILILCQYWSEETAQMLGVKHYMREMSPWIQETINLFKNKNDVELIVVAPNYTSNKDVLISRDGIKFFFFKYSPELLSHFFVILVKSFIKHKEPYKIAERVANLFTGYRYPRKRIPPIIEKFNPDLIHLYGSENPDYSVGVIPLINKYKILLTIQGYAYLIKDCHSPLLKFNQHFRTKFEKYINTKVNYVTNYGLDYGFEPFFNGQKKYVLSAITKIPPYNASLAEKEFDIVFFARINEEKGIEDLIRSVAFLKRQGNALKTLVIGKAEEKYLDRLMTIIKRDKVEELFTFTGFVEKHDDVYRMAASAKLLAFPSHNDVSPNTVREAMFMKLPIVAYNVGGMPYFNIHRECLHLSKLGDIESFSEGIMQIINNRGYREVLIDNAFKEANEFYRPEKVYEQSISIYKEILK